MDCACDRCQNLCRQKPGWFTPDQVAPLARKLNLSIGELFQRFLRIDAVLVAERSQKRAIFVLAPAMAGKKSGAVADPGDRGMCVWFVDGRCGIHEMKPRECGLVDHRTTPAEGDLLRAGMLKQWASAKGFVQDLYGKKLKAPEALKQAYRKIKRERQASPQGEGRPQ